MTDPADLGILEAHALLRDRKLSAVELTAACLRRIEERNGGPPTHDGAPDAINAWARLYPERAHRDAFAADERLHSEGEAAPLLCGIPIGVKDLYEVDGLPLTASSRVLAENPAATDATAWARLRDRGTRGGEAQLTQAAIDLQEHALGVPAWTPEGALSPAG